MTVAEVEDILGAYVSPDGDFLMSLSQVLPRLQEMGLWKDLTYPITYSGALGYVSLPGDTDSVLACSLDEYPAAVRSLWHDVIFSGRHPIISSNTGIVDDGFYPITLDMKDVQGVELVADIAPLTTLTVLDSGRTTPPTSFDGTITVEMNVNGTGATQTVSAAFVSTNLNIVASEGFTKVTKISYTGVLEPLDIVDPNFPTMVMATIPVGTGTLRFRRFRVAYGTTYVHLLLKRVFPKFIDSSTEIFISNIGAIKHGLLAVISEDNSDLERAGRHWGQAAYLLDQELKSIMGAAKPSIRVDLSGGGSAAPIQNFY
jgi:hypothetical protein|tara:strand:- start:4025 stop:4969 length:945 start_codon:yes stop_codon:yes gene_type:complete